MSFANTVLRTTAGALAACAIVCSFASPAAATPATALGSSSQQTGRHFTSSTGLVTVVDPATLGCTQTTTFDDVAGGPAPGTNYDNVFTSTGVAFGERFLGQTLSYNGDFDVITGNPSNPLLLGLGAPGQNLNIFAYNPSNVLTGLGNAGFPNFNAIGEGSFAMYFSAGQSQLGFSLVGGDGGTATLDFYRADGSFIDEIVLTGLSNTAYGFARAGSIPDIAGVLVQNDDPAGIGLDDVCHDVGVVPAHPASWGHVKSVYR